MTLFYRKRSTIALHLQYFCASNAALLECKRGTFEGLKGYIGMAKGVRLKDGTASGDKRSTKNRSAKL